MRIIRRARHIWKFNPVWESSQFAIVKDTYRTFFEDLAGWKRLYYVEVWQENDENADKNIRISAEIDGISIVSPQYIMEDRQQYFIEYGSVNIPPGGGIFLLASKTRTLFMRYTYLSAESIKFQFQTTSAPGTNQGLRGRISRSELVLV